MAADMSSSSRRSSDGVGLAHLEPFATAFELPLDDGGLCVAVTLPLYPCKDDDEYCPTLPLDELHAQECAALDSMTPTRQVQFAGGRAAMRRALMSLGLDVTAPVLSLSSGAPDLRGVGALGSISHTRGLATAIACPPQVADADEEGRALQPPAAASSHAGPDPLSSSAVGIDVERASRQLNPRMARRVLHETERRSLGARPCAAVPDAATDLLLRCSLKEALYKALHPLVRRTIRWHTVQIEPMPDGSCELKMAELEAAVGFGLSASARWQLQSGFFVTTAMASLQDGGGDASQSEAAEAAPCEAAEAVPSM